MNQIIASFKDVIFEGKTFYNLSEKQRLKFRRYVDTLVADVNLSDTKTAIEEFKKHKIDRTNRHRLIIGLQELQYKLETRKREIVGSLFLNDVCDSDILLIEKELNHEIDVVTKEIKFHEYIQDRFYISHRTGLTEEQVQKVEDLANSIDNFNGKGISEDTTCKTNN